jgi:hypothetical protein
VEFQEATDKEALEFLKASLGEVKFNEKRNELMVLVKNYTGGKFMSLLNVAQGVGNLEGTFWLLVSYCQRNVMID